MHVWDKNVSALLTCVRPAWRVHTAITRLWASCCVCWSWRRLALKWTGWDLSVKFVSLELVTHRIFFPTPMHTYILHNHHTHTHTHTSSSDTNFTLKSQPVHFRASLLQLQQTQQLAQRWVMAVCTLQAGRTQGTNHFWPVFVRPGECIQPLPVSEQAAVFVGVGGGWLWSE